MVARTLLAVAATRYSEEASDIGLFDIMAAFVHSPIELNVLIPSAGDCLVRPGTLVEKCTVRNAQSLEALCKNQLKGLEQRWVDSEQSIFQGHCTTGSQGHFFGRSDLVGS